MSSEKPMIDYATILADLEAKKAAIESLIASFRLAAASGALVMGEVSIGAGVAFSQAQGIGSVNDIPNGAFHGKSITEAAKAFLEMIKKKQTTREIADALLKGGMETTSERFQTNVHGILLRASKEKGEIVRVGNAWGLAGWYPTSMRAAQPKNGKKISKRKRGRPKKVTTHAEKQIPVVGTDQSQKMQSSNGTGLQTRVLQFLKENEREFEPAQIAKAMNTTIAAVNLTLGRLMKTGKILKGQGMYGFNG